FSARSARSFARECRRASSFERRLPAFSAVGMRTQRTPRRVHGSGLDFWISPELAAGSSLRASILDSSGIGKGTGSSRTDAASGGTSARVHGGFNPGFDCFPAAGRDVSCGPPARTVRSRLRAGFWCYRGRVSELRLDELFARFVAGTIPREEWTHQAHLAVGLWHVHRYGAEEALERLRTGILALNERHGTPNTETRGYHETITVAYVRLLDQFLSASDANRSLEARLAELLSGPLGDRALLSRFWSREGLMAPAARVAWPPPALGPLVLPRAPRE